MSRRFAGLYATTGRPSIPPEQLLRALLLHVLYTVRSDRLLMEELNYNLLFRWFVGLSMDDPVWHPTTFTKNRDRLLAGEIAAAFFEAVQTHARAAGLLSDEHFTVDGTQLEAWASLKSFRCVDAAESDPPDDPGNPTVNFHGERRRNDTHQSTTDPEAMLHRKGTGKEAKLAYLGHVLLDNREGLVANVWATHATGTAERDAAALLLEASARRCCIKRPCGGEAVWPALLVTLRRSHTTGMKSKVHPTYKTKYRVANWPAYNRALVRRGDVTVWVSSEAIAAWTASRSGRRGGQRRYSDLAIETALTLRFLSHLPLRQAEGFLHALFGDNASRPLRSRLYDALPAQSAFEAPSAIAGPARRGPPSRARQHGAVPRRGR